MRSSLILKVNNDGTGEIIECPNSDRKSQILVLLPVPTTIFWQAKTSELVSIFQKFSELYRDLTL